MTEDAIPVWPAGLPVGLLAGYGYQRDDNRVISNPAIGPARVRVQSKTGKTTFPLNFYFTNDQLAQFEVFYEHVLESGSLRFIIPLKSGIGITDYEVFILKRGKTSVRGRGWNQSVTLQTLDRI